MYVNHIRKSNLSGVEQLEDRAMLDCSGALTGDIAHEPSEWVATLPRDVLRFASLRVGEVSNGRDTVVLDNDEIVEVQGNDLSMAQVKGYLHLFADSIGTNQFIETLDIRFSPWGRGSGSTTGRFEDFISDNLDLAIEENCDGLRFSQKVQWDLPGEGGEFFTGGFLDIDENGQGTLLHSGDIAEFVESYELTSVGDVKTLTVNTHVREVQFAINEDSSLTDEFGQIWNPESTIEIIDPNAVDTILGDIDGNGTVEFKDFLILSQNFGSDAEEADLDGDGEVGFADFLLLSNNFGKSA